MSKASLKLSAVSARKRRTSGKPSPIRADKVSEADESTSKNPNRVIHTTLHYHFLSDGAVRTSANICTHFSILSTGVKHEAAGPGARSMDSRPVQKRPPTPDPASGAVYDNRCVRAGLTGASASEVRLALAGLRGCGAGFVERDRHRHLRTLLLMTIDAVSPALKLFMAALSVSTDVTLVLPSFVMMSPTLMPALSAHAPAETV